MCPSERTLSLGLEHRCRVRQRSGLQGALNLEDLFRSAQKLFCWFFNLSLVPRTVEQIRDCFPLEAEKVRKRHLYHISLLGVVVLLMDHLMVNRSDVVLRHQLKSCCRQAGIFKGQTQTSSLIRFEMSFWNLSMD